MIVFLGLSSVLGSRLMLNVDQKIQNSMIKNFSGSGSNQFKRLKNLQK